MRPIFVDIPITVCQSTFKLQVQWPFRLFSHYIIPINMGIPMCTVVADGYLPFLVDPDFQLYNKMDHFTAGCFMAMPFPYSVIQDDYKFNAF